MRFIAKISAANFGGVKPAIRDCLCKLTEIHVLDFFASDVIEQINSGDLIMECTVNVIVTDKAFVQSRSLCTPDKMPGKVFYRVEVWFPHEGDSEDFGDCFRQDLPEDEARACYIRMASNGWPVMMGTRALYVQILNPDHEVIIRVNDPERA